MDNQDIDLDFGKCSIDEFIIDNDQNGYDFNFDFGKCSVDPSTEDKEIFEFCDQCVMEKEEDSEVSSLGKREDFYENVDEQLDTTVAYMQIGTDAFGRPMLGYASVGKDGQYEVLSTSDRRHPFFTSPTSTPPLIMTPVRRRVCQFFDKPRGCWNGDSCQFLHTNERRPDLSSWVNPTARVKCQFYGTAKGCRNGNFCQFKHD